MKGIKRGVILSLTALILLMPFSFIVSASEISVFDISSSQVGAYNWWYRHGFGGYTYSMLAGSDVSSFSGKLKCTGESVDSTGVRRCTIWSADSVESYSILDNYEIISDGSITGSYLDNGSFNINCGFNLPQYDNTQLTEVSFAYATYRIEGTYDLTSSSQVVPHMLTGQAANMTISVSNFYFGGIDYHLVTFRSTEASALSFDIPSLSGLKHVLPLYFGYTISMPESVYSIFNAPRGQLVYMIGDSSSDSAGSNIDNKSDALSSAASSLNSIESQYLTNMNLQMNNIDFTGEGVALINNGNFLTSANWVRTQFNRMTSNNVFGTMIYFSLVLGLSLLVLGKLRK